MNNWRFEHFVPWEKFSLFETQESKPLHFESPEPLHHIESLFGKDFRNFMCHFELEFVRNIQEVHFDINRPQLSTGNVPLSSFHLWVMIPHSKALNFTSTGWLGLHDFPYMGQFDDGLRLNFSLNARSAILFSIFQQSKTFLDFGEDERCDFDDTPLLLCFKLGAKKLFELFSSQEAGLWNRKYLDYFIGLNNGVELSAQEVKTVRAYTFADGFTFGQLVKLSNQELDEWTTPNGDKTFHWRHFHLPLCKSSVVSSLIDLEWIQDQPETLMAGLTRTLSELSLGSFEVVAEQNATLDSDEATLNSATLEEDVQDELEEVLSEFVYCTAYGAKYHTFEDCKGMNSRPFTRFTLAEAAVEHTLCYICQKRKAGSE